MERVDVLVVGAGVVGTAAALALAERGASVALLEQFELAHRRGSSHGATRIFRFAYPEPDYVRLAGRALERWRALEAATGEGLLVTTGGLYTGTWADECAAGLAACGVDHEWLSPEAAGECWPAIRFDGYERVLHQPGGGVCLADRTVMAQARLARGLGIALREGEAALTLRERADGVEVETAAGAWSAGTVVVAAGSWAGPLLAAAGIGLRLAPARTQVSYFALSREVTPAELPPLVEAGAGVGMLGTGGYWVPPVDGQPGVKVSLGAPGAAVDPAESPFTADPDREARDTQFAAARLPLASPEPLRTDSCLYTMTPDEDFVLDRLGRIVVASCCSGHGFKFGPYLGELAARLALGEEPGVPLGRFSARRPAVIA